MIHLNNKNTRNLSLEKKNSQLETSFFAFLKCSVNGTYIPDLIDIQILLVIKNQHTLHKNMNHQLNILTKQKHRQNEKF